MNFDIQKYGQPTRHSCDVFTEESLTPTVDNWSDGRFESHVNSMGVLVHRFQIRNSNNALGNMPDAIKKILKGDVPTPCTLIGPSASHTYSHAMWANSAGLVFGPNTRQVLGYKGDFWSNRLAELTTKTHSDFRGIFNLRNKLDSVRDYSRHLEQAFGKTGMTESYFGDRKKKKLCLVNSVRFLQNKVREMEARANLHFTPQAYRPAENFDCASKVIIARIWEQSGMGRPLTKNALIECLKQWIHSNPKLAVFLQAAFIKLMNMPSNDAVVKYLDAAKRGQNGHSYASLIEKRATDQSASSAVNRSTALSPNETLALPSAKNLVGVYIQTTSKLGFEQVLKTHATLLKHSKTREWAMRVPPFTQVITHRAACSVIQLGWSKHVIPWSQDGLLQYVTKGFIFGIDHSSSRPKQFEPDLFLLLERFAEHAVIAKGPNPLQAHAISIEPNLPQDIHEYNNAQGQSVLELAVRHKRKQELIELLCCLNNVDTPKGKLNLDAAIAAAPVGGDLHTKLTTYRSMNANQRENVWLDLICEQMNARFKNRRLEKKYRNGYLDQGSFRMNRGLCSLALAMGTRKYPDGCTVKGVFYTESNCTEGGSTPMFGILHLNANTLQLGKLHTSGPFNEHRADGTYLKMNPDQGEYCTELHLQRRSHSLRLSWSKQGNTLKVTCSRQNHLPGQDWKRDTVLVLPPGPSHAEMREKPWLALGHVLLVVQGLNKAMTWNCAWQNWARSFEAWKEEWLACFSRLNWNDLPETPVRQEIRQLGQSIHSRGDICWVCNDS